LRNCEPPFQQPATPIDAPSRRCCLLLRVAIASILSCACIEPAAAAPDACAVDAPVALCQGDQSAGIASGTDFPGAFTTLMVNNLTTSIAPAAGTDGVEFTSAVPITLVIDAGAFGIVASGNGSGIFAASNGAVVLSSIADISTADGSGITAGSNATLTLNHIGNITTTGDNARGISASTTPNGFLRLSSIGNIKTSGAGSHGILSSNITGTNTVLHLGNITTSGNGSDGIRAGNTNGDVTVITSGNISASGGGSAGISASSNTGDISVTVASGQVTGGSGAGAGVEFIGGATNTLHNFGSISALSGLAISGGGNDETVNNRGTVTGNVDLGGGSNAFNNLAGGVFNSGSTVDAGDVTNAGILSPGGSNAIQMTALDDRLVQTRTGVLAIDVNATAGTSDEIIVSDTAALDGFVRPRLMNLPGAGTQQFTILQALGGVTDNGLMLLASPALHAALSFTATDVVLSTSVDFASIDGLNGNQRAIADSLHQAFILGGGGLTPVLLGLLNTGSLEAYEAALNQLSPELYSDAQISALYAGLGFANSLLSCKTNGPGTASIIYEGQCLWAGASAVFLDQNTTASRIGFKDTSGLFAAGAQVKLDEFWRFGFGASYQKSSIDTPTAAQSDGELAQGGIALKYNIGSVIVAGTVTVGRGWYDTTRPIDFGGFTGLAQSSSGIDIVNAGTRIGYTFGTPQLYFKPVLDMSATWLDLEGFTETGGGAANLSISGNDKTIYTVLPSIEIGTEWWLANGTLVRPFLRGGLAWYSGGDFALDASFVAAPVGVSPFTIHTGIDNALGTLGAGLDMISANDTVLHVSYDGQLGETTQIHSVGLKGSARF
jgi:uncharacterized protein with beta-barrel porin domain